MVKPVFLSVNTHTLHTSRRKNLKLDKRNGQENYLYIGLDLMDTDLLFILTVVGRAVLPYWTTYNKKSSHTNKPYKYKNNTRN